MKVRLETARLILYKVACLGAGLQGRVHLLPPAFDQNGILFVGAVQRALGGEAQLPHDLSQGRQTQGHRELAFDEGGGLWKFLLRCTRPGRSVRSCSFPVLPSATADLLMILYTHTGAASTWPFAAFDRSP